MYKIINDKTVLRLIDNVFIPFDESNSDYQMYVRWLEHNIPESADIVSTVPKQVSMSQARLALIQNNLLTAVDSAVSQAGIEAKTYWEYSSTVEIAHPLVQAIKMQLNWTDDQLNALFILANSL